MTAAATNVHGTAIVIGTRGILFVGPSGSGKSATAFACMAAARRQGAFAALVSDDQVLISRQGKRLLADRPVSIAGLLEMRGTGIVGVDSIPTAVLDLAVQLISPHLSDRLPAADERYTVANIGELPLVRLSNTAADPLASIAALFSSLQGETPF